MRQHTTLGRKIGLVILIIFINVSLAIQAGGEIFSKNEYAVINRSKDMKICAFYEPKVHLKKWGDANYDTFDDQMQAIQDDIQHILDTWGGTKGYLHYRGKPVIAIFGLYSALVEDGMEDRHWCAIRQNLSAQGYDFILVGDTVPDGDDFAWFTKHSINPIDCNQLQGIFQ